jgi:uncharacterized protein
VLRGPLVLSRDENSDPDFNKTVIICSKDGYIDAIADTTCHDRDRVVFKIPTGDGPIQMVNYASVNSWNGKRVCTWLPVLK